ncbi:MAG: hypothetical protein K9G33_03245 [Sneathiella sp.]|nr:hypothetical protein [Sneathiella sp.]
MDVINLAVGLAFGVIAGALFFAGLGLGVRLALKGASPGPILLMSAALRISLLLLSGWAVAQLGLWSAVGFGAAFLATRYAIVTWARAPIGREG